MFYLCLVNERNLVKIKRNFRKDLKHCGVMKLLADMPSRLEGGDHRINLV